MCGADDSAASQCLLLLRLITHFLADLSLSRYPTFKSIDERLEPSALYLQIGRWITLAKIWCISWVLSAIGKSREARLLSTAYKAFGVYNSRRYDRSITCAVDNVRSLQAQMTPDDRQLLPLVWEESVMSWPNYGYLVCAGIRKLLFRTHEESVVPSFVTIPKFQTWPAGDPNVLRLAASSAAADMTVSVDLDAFMCSKDDRKRSEGVVNLTAKAL